MNLYRIKIRLRAATGTLWQSDTLFGHLCWLVARRDGEEGLGHFLEPFMKGEPQFVLSDGFPEATLPMPLIPSTMPKESVSLNDYHRHKKQRKAAYIKTEQFIALCNGEQIKGDIPDASWEPIETLHASIDRNTNRTGGEDSEGSLFQTTAWIPKSDERRTGAFDIYARASSDGLTILTLLLSELTTIGFGKDKSTGYGRFEFDPGKDISSVEDFDGIDGSNGFVSLSSYIPASDDPVDGFWKVRTKRGKLGEERSLSVDPFKRALIQFEPGAFFRTNGNPRPFYGRMVSNIAPAMPDVVQCGYTIAIPIVARQL
jgi:CRISPR-associated protein Csm4